MTKLILEKFLPYRLNRIAAQISKDFRLVYGPDSDLTIPEWRVLATLGEFDEMTAKAIGEHSSLHKTKVSRAVFALEKRRWLKRDTNPDDRREEILRLTKFGRQAYMEIVPRALAFEQKILQELGATAPGLLKGLARFESVNATPRPRGAKSPGRNRA